MVHYRGCFFGPIPSIPRKFACHWFKSSNFYPSEKFMINIPLSNSSMGLYPLVIQHSYGKSPLLMGKSTISTGPFSIAMLNYQRVTKGLSIQLVQSLGNSPKSPGLEHEKFRWLMAISLLRFRLTFLDPKSCCPIISHDILPYPI